jgi:hypothetical protein
MEIASTGSFYDLKPKWGFALADFNHDKWGLTVNADRLSGVLRYLGNLEILGEATWHEILTDTSGRKSNTRNHFISVTEICREARRRLVELKREDQDRLLSIATKNLTRVWGIIDEDGVCYILWIDPRHEIYPVAI